MAVELLDSPLCAARSRPAAVPIIVIVCLAVRRYRHPGWMVPTLVRVAAFVLVVVFFRAIGTIQVDTYYGGCD